MGEHDGGTYWGPEPGEIPELPREPESNETIRVRQLRAELARYVDTLEHNGLIDMPVEAVAAALSKKAAIECMIGETARRRQAVEDDRRRRLEEEERRTQEGLQALRAAMETDAALRREVESRNSSDSFKKRLSRSCEHFGPLPGGFSDALRKKL